MDGGLIEYSPAADLRRSEVSRVGIERAVAALCVVFDQWGAESAFSLLESAGILGMAGGTLKAGYGSDMASLTFEIALGLREAVISGEKAKMRAAIDEARMEFGYRRRQQLFAKGWIV